MTTEADNAHRLAGFEEPYLAYERARRQKHAPDHLSPLETLVLRRVVASGGLEQHTLASQIGRSSLSRVVSSLAERNLLKSTIDSRDRRRHVLYPTGPGQRLLAKLDAAHAASPKGPMDVQPAAPTPSSPEQASPEPMHTMNSDQPKQNLQAPSRAAAGENGTTGDDKLAPDPVSCN